MTIISQAILNMQVAAHPRRKHYTQASCEVKELPSVYEILRISMTFSCLVGPENSPCNCIKQVKANDTEFDYKSSARSSPIIHNLAHIHTRSDFRCTDHPSPRSYIHKQLYAMYRTSEPRDEPLSHHTQGTANFEIHRKLVHEIRIKYQDELLREA